MLIARMEFFSDGLNVKQLDVKQDVNEVFELQKKHTNYHQQFNLGVLTKGQIEAEMVNFPKNKTLEDKFYLGFYQAGILIAVLDLVLDYPKANCVWIGLLIVDTAKLCTGIGTNVWKIARQALKREGYTKTLLAIPASDERSQSFWQKQRFKEQQVFQMDLKKGVTMPFKLMKSEL